MKNYRKPAFQLIGALIIGLTLLLASACGNPLTVGNQSAINNPDGTGSLSLNLGTAARTINPIDPAQYALASYQITGAGPNAASFDSGTLASPAFTKTGLIPGSWTITVWGVNSYGHVISEAVLPVSIVASQTTSSLVSLARKSGSGTLEIQFTWQAPGEYDSISGTLSSASGGQPISFTINGASNGAVYSSVLPAGNYSVLVSLSKDSVVKESLVETAQVFDGYTSIASFDRTLAAAPENYNYSSASPVYSVDFLGARSRQITVSGASGKQVYLVKANISPDVISSAYTGKAASAKELLPYTEQRLSQAEIHVPDAGRIYRRDNAAATAFNANPPTIEKSASSRGLPGLSKNPSISYGGTTSYTVNYSYKFFWVQNASGNWMQILATLRAVGNYCYIWVADSNYNNSSVAINDDYVTSAQATALKDKFDGTLANSYNDGIFKNVTSIFGYEYGGGPGGNGGRDGDQHVSVLVYDIDYDYSASQGGGTFGFFWGKDYYTQAEMDGQGLKTNNSEIFYVDSYFMDRVPNMVVSTLAHEYQHMINFNQKWVKYSANSSTWFNEMCSMVAEDLVLANIGLDPVNDGAQSRLNEFTYHYAESGLSDWLSDKDVLKSYAGAFSFGAYLARNYGGAAFFQNMAINSLVNEAAISSALAAGGYSDTFVDAFKHYGEALVFTTPPAGSSVKTLKQEVAKSVGGITYTASSIDLSAIQQYSYASGSYTGMYGIRSYAPNATMALRPYGNSVHSQASWANLTGDLVINLFAPYDPNVKYYLMVK